MATPQSMPDGAPAAVVVIDTEGTVIGWTPSAQELLGYPAAEILDRSGALLLMPERAATWDPSYGDGEHWSGFAEARHRDGTRILVRVEGSRLITPDEQAAWLVTVTPAASAVSGRACSWMEPILNRSPVAVAIWDRDLRCVWLNDAAERLRAVFPHYQLGRSLAERLPGVNTEAAQEAMRKVIVDGVPQLDREARWTSVDQHEDRTLSTSLFRLEGVDGRPLGVCSVAIDISHSRARDRLALLREASVRIGSTLDVRKTAQELADLAVPALADYVTVDLAEAVLPDTEPLQRLAATDVRIPVFRRAGVASIHEGTPESLWQRGQAVFVPPSSPFTAVLSSGRAHFEPVLDTSPGSWIEQDPDRARIVRGTGMHTLIVVPLKARGDILGVAVFVRNDNPEPFTTDDLILAEELGARAGLSLDNARRYTRERNAALALQRNLLPRNLAGAGAVEVVSHYLPTDVHEGVGGDWFDAIPLGDGRVALVVGDVTGHGINAAATMGRLRTAVRTLAYLGLPPDELLARLDDLLVRLSEEDAGPDGFPLDPTGATCVYAVYDAATRRCTIAGAGHPPPAIVTPSGEVFFPRPPGGTPIGLGVGSYESFELELAEGSLIALYTDGLIETRQADIEAGIDRLGAALAHAAALPLEHACASVIRTMVGETGSEDDIALLLARTCISTSP
ncbi:PAS domain S-box-containing protein [Nonomuraea polychroma]|uniref:protein-serine/threonine phosphatase n=1 Tax=Nonomuraea polychroma TaxID=46176 RepID=A0A438M4Y0_9ACTN|nr:SpoIIE family protein phosphatase [Nonomuraea polychroma]RVX40869.1 PAS domain S-box-containing protein [Nonomuraea polychroma]